MNALDWHERSPWLVESDEWAITQAAPLGKTVWRVWYRDRPVTECGVQVSFRTRDAAMRWIEQRMRAEGA